MILLAQVIPIKYKMLDQNQQQNDNTTGLTGQGYVTSEPLGPNNPGIVVPQNPPQVTQPSIQNQPQVNTLTRSVPTVDVNPSPIVNASLPAPNQVAQPTPAIHPVMDANAPVTNQPSPPNQASHANTVPPGLQGIVNGSENLNNFNSQEDSKKSKKQKVIISITGALACLLIIGGFFLYAFVLREDKKPFLTKYEQMQKTITEPYRGLAGAIFIYTDFNYINKTSEENKLNRENDKTSLEIADKKFEELEKEYNRYNAFKDREFKNLAKAYTGEIRECIDSLKVINDDYTKMAEPYNALAVALTNYESLKYGDDFRPSIDTISSTKTNIETLSLNQPTLKEFQKVTLEAIDAMIVAIEDRIRSQTAKEIGYFKYFDDYDNAKKNYFRIQRKIISLFNTQMRI